MSLPRATFSLLRFCAGSQQLGIAADDVVAITSARSDAIHIATVLDLRPEPALRAPRVIRVVAPLAEPAEPPELGELEFQVDGPVEVVRCPTENIMPLASGLPPEYWKPVMGVARIGEDTILLLDIPSVARALRTGHD